MKYSLICLFLFCLNVSGSEVDNEIEQNEIDVDDNERLKPNWQDYTTKNPWHPQLSFYTKKAEIRIPKIAVSSNKLVSTDPEKNTNSSQSAKNTKVDNQFRQKRTPIFKIAKDITKSSQESSDSSDESSSGDKSISIDSQSSKKASDSSSQSAESTKNTYFRKKRSLDTERTLKDPTTEVTLTTIETTESSPSTIQTTEKTEVVDSVSELTSTTIKHNDEEEIEETTTVTTVSDETISNKDEIEEEEEGIIITTTETVKDITNENETLTENPNNANETILNNALQRVDKLSDQIRAVLQHYQQAGVVALPGKNMLPDPLPMADTQNNFGFGTTMTFTNMSVYGLNNFTIEHVNTDVDKLQVYLLLHMKRIVILGNYTFKSFFRRASGPFNVTLVDVDSEGAAELTPDEDGQLQASDSQMDMFTKSMKTDFKNLKSSILSSLIDGAAVFLFDAMKPAILDKVNTVLRTDFNKKLKSITSKLTKSVSPVDIALAEGRRYCKKKGYDPYHVQNLQSNQGFFVIDINDFYLEGMSRFYRVGNLSLSMDSGVIQIGIHVATGQLNGTCDWSIEVGHYKRRSKSHFTVEYMQVRALVNQSLDIRKHPQIDDLDIGLGKVHLKPGSDSAIDFMIAKVVSSLPKLIRHIIVDAVEEPLKEKVQEILNDVNINEIVEEKLPELDKFGF